MKEATEVVCARVPRRVYLGMKRVAKLDRASVSAWLAPRLEFLVERRLEEERNERRLRRAAGGRG